MRCNVSIATLEPVRIDDEFYERVAQLLAIRGGDDINDRCCTIPRPAGDRATTVGNAPPIQRAALCELPTLAPQLG
jgi:hypothetical protein